MKPQFNLTVYFNKNPVTLPQDFVAVAVKYDATIVGPIKEDEGRYSATARLVNPTGLGEICDFVVDMGKITGVDYIVGIASRSLRITHNKGLLQIVADYRGRT